MKNQKVRDDKEIESLKQQVQLDSKDKENLNKQIDSTKDKAHQLERAVLDKDGEITKQKTLQKQTVEDSANERKMLQGQIKAEKDGNAELKRQIVEIRAMLVRHDEKNGDENKVLAWDLA